MGESEAREFSRVPISIVAAATSGECDPVAGRVRDISLNGVFIMTQMPMGQGTPCSVTIQLSGQTTGPLVRCGGEVVRVDDDGMAVQFDQITGEDSYEHLRNLIRYNSAEIDQVDAEFREHTGLKRREG